MDKIYDKCCGIDVHKKLIVACFRCGKKQEIREFGATTRELLELADRLKEGGCEMTAMESTASYWKPLNWKPLYNILESSDLERHGGECPPYESRSRTEDRCERCRMDCRPSSAWTASARLYP